MNKGFTLIELLVVVLIIGILASIALPQYTRAVERARMLEAVQALEDLSTAQRIYYLHYGIFANSLDDLNEMGDINISDPSIKGNWTLEVDGGGGVQTITRQGGVYDGSYLRLIVEQDGSVTKQCFLEGHEKFCRMADSYGYKVPGPNRPPRPEPH